METMKLNWKLKGVESQSMAKYAVYFLELHIRCTCQTVTTKLTTRSSAGIGNFRNLLNLSSRYFDKRSSRMDKTPVIIAATLDVAMFLNKYM